MMARTPNHHELKVVPPFFDHLFDGTKTFEVRRDDRGFEVGDLLWLREWDGYFTGRSMTRRVAFLFKWDDGPLGKMLAEGVVVMAFTADLEAGGWR